MDTYRDSKGRTVTEEEIALRWIGRNRDRTLQALGKAPPPIRQFGVQGKALDDGRVQLTVSDPDDAA